MNEKGQTLIEVLAGLAAATVVIAAITVATLSSLYNTQFSRDQSQATQYAQEGMETMRNLRDYSIASVSALLDAPTYCMSQGCTYITGDTLDTKCGPAQGTQCRQNIDKFIREVNIDHASLDCNASKTNAVKITVTVLWNDSKCGDAANPFCHQVNLSSCLSDFIAVPTP